MSKIQFKKIISCLMGMVLLGSLAACGQPAAQQASSSGQSQESQATTSQSSSPQAPQSSETASTPEPGSSQVSKAPQSSSEAPKSESTPPATPDSKGGVLVVYFSATGNTKAVAEFISAATEGELYEIVPETPYTSDDLDWTVAISRSNKEHEDPSIRPAIAGDAKDLSDYNTVFIGYPLWWGEAPNIVWNFVESSDLSGKTVIPFATSASSGFGSSGKTLEGFATDANWLDGQRFQSGAAKEDVESWVNGFNLS